MRLGQTLWLAALLCGAGACKFETAVTPATQIVVDIDADPAIREQTQELRLAVSAAPRRSQLEARKPVFNRKFPRAGGDLEEPIWPVRLVMTPSEGGLRRVFALTASVTNADGELVTQARVVTGYVEHQMRQARIQLDAACIGVSCGELETCRAGACEDAWVEPRDLPLLGRGTSVPRPALDAGPVDGGPDAETPEAGPAPSRCSSNNGGCDPLVTCDNTDGGVLCGLCPTGFLDVHEDGTRCDDVNECASNNGGCDPLHAGCTNTRGGRDCTCEAGFHGDGRECTTNVPCTEDPAVCDSQATCQSGMGTQLCMCGAGYEGDGGQCRDIDECARKLATCGPHSACLNNPGAYTCPCDAGYAMKDGSCADIDECGSLTDNCDDMPEACVNSDGAFKCMCPPGFMGPGIGSEGCADIDECTLKLGNCSADATCTNTPGSFSCGCKPGYTGDGVSCVDADECQMGGGSNCSADANCANTPGSFTCSCKPGYTGDGVSCSDVNECAMDLDNCDRNAQCRNQPGSFRCRCNNGYTGNGMSCTDVNECATDMDNCDPNADCANTPGSFTCTCKAGFMGDGRTCTPSSQSD